jgi:hypothetical protein
MNFYVYIQISIVNHVNNVNEQIWHFVYTKNQSSKGLQPNVNNVNRILYMEYKSID